MHGYEPLNLYFGDLHSHCNVGYGHGSLDDAYTNARLQLDFVAITPHAYWHDIPSGESRLDDLVAYHRRGFARTEAAWSEVQAAAERNHHPGEFIPFLAFEWHSNTYGDHNVYYREPTGEVLRVDSLEELRQAVRTIQTDGGDAFLIPHHIGYRSGSRGINWDTFTSEFSPVVEAMSMHGAAEGPDAPFNYLHTMGPRDWRSTYQYGLSQGHVAGIIGSTDHHSGHPGSYGHGKLAVWADELSRSGIWEAIKARRTYALSGDRIGLRFTVDDVPMGGSVEPSGAHRIEFDVEGGGAIDYVDVVHNNRVIHRTNGFETSPAEDPFGQPIKCHFEVGWGEVGVPVDWDVSLHVNGGELAAVEPRFRGGHVVAPMSQEAPRYTFSRFEHDGRSVTFTTATSGNSNSSTAGTQGVNLEIRGDAATSIEATINGQTTRVPLQDLLDGPHSGYLGGFLTPAYVFHRALPSPAYRASAGFDHDSPATERGWYYVRVRQYNGHWAWSSPVWSG